MTLPPQLPRDKETLLREISATIRIKDIRSLQRLRDQVEVKWWESGLILLLFVSALGLLATIALALLRHGGVEGARPALVEALMFWGAIFVFSVVLGLEVVLRKINALRRLNEITSRILEAARAEWIETRQEPGRGESQDEHPKDRQDKL